jgi:glycine betaine/proline transport system permease protein
MQARHIVLSCGFAALIVVATVIHYSFPGTYAVLSTFPTEQFIRLTAIKWVEGFFAFCVTHGETFFDLISYGIWLVLDALELAFVKTPWMVIVGFILLLTGLSAGVRAAIFSGASLVYMGALGFWDKAMTTLALLGTAASLRMSVRLPSPTVPTNGIC